MVLNILEKQGLTKRGKRYILCDVAMGAVAIPRKQSGALKRPIDLLVKTTLKLKANKCGAPF